MLSSLQGLLDYEFESDDEWVEEEGESLSDSDDDKDKDKDKDEDDEEEDEEVCHLGSESF